MNLDHANGLAAGYAWASEDITGTPTATPPGKVSGDFEFARAYAQGRADYDAQRRGTMITVREAYHNWQASGGLTIFARGELTLGEDERTELRLLNYKGDHDAYFAAARRMQDAAWAALEAARG